MQAMDAAKANEDGDGAPKVEASTDNKAMEELKAKLAAAEKERDEAKVDIEDWQKLAQVRARRTGRPGRLCCPPTRPSACLHARSCTHKCMHERTNARTHACTQTHT